MLSGMWALPGGSLAAALLPYKRRSLWKDEASVEVITLETLDASPEQKTTKVLPLRPVDCAGRSSTIGL